MSLSNRKQEIASRFSRAALSYASHAALQQSIADTLLARTALAGVVLDAGCGSGRESRLLAAKPAVQEVIALDIAPAMLAALPSSSCIRPQLGDMESIPLPADSVDTVFSSFAMQWCESSTTVAEEFSRVLKPGGRLLASVPGPRSLAGLRAGGWLHVNEFRSAENWRAALDAAGFRQLQFHHQDFAMHFDGPRELLRALKGIGANTADMPRENHLLGRHWLADVTRVLEAMREPQGLPLRYEVIFMEAVLPT